ncbi:NAD(P)H-dependent oxidoreductase [Cognatishimia sp. WU-CL00825]|uniref:FMN-dependent NADH-azoreductase n=1 Tax=Cognatishimia sp. WU-CL00825 TaxID=3127658 RepID=UPI003109FBB8
MTHSVLHIDSSARYIDSISRRLSAGIATSLQADTVVRRDLSEGLPFLNETWVSATFTPKDDRSEAQAEALKTSDILVQELQNADTIVIGLPLYNFGVPASLKAWIDLIARAGVTFQYTDTGPKGLLSGKKAIITIASGGVDIGSPMDFASPYLRQVLGFLGISDVTILSSSQAEDFAKAA